jgi:hypothetical protein
MDAFLKIEKNIPVPTSSARKGHNIELLRQMQPGDSVFFDAPILKKATRFYRVAKQLKVKVIIRKEGNGMRMWRMPDDYEGASTAPVSKPHNSASSKAAKKRSTSKESAARKATPKPAAPAKKAAPKTAPKKRSAAKRPARDPSKPTREQLRAKKRAEKASMADLPMVTAHHAAHGVGAA